MKKTKSLIIITAFSIVFAVCFVACDHIEVDQRELDLSKPYIPVINQNEDSSNIGKTKEITSFEVFSKKEKILFEHVKLYLENGRYLKVIMRLNKFLDTKPESIPRDEALFFLAKAYCKLDDKTKCIDALKLAIKTNPASKRSADELELLIKIKGSR